MIRSSEQRRRSAPAAVASLLVAIVASISPSASGQTAKYGAGVTDTEIKLGQTVPYSGPASAFGTIGRAQQAYFAKINTEGGINGRKVTLISVDDGFNPAKTVEQTRRLIEADQVLAMFSSLGPGTVAVKKYVNQKQVPYLFLGDGAKEWDDRTASPWSVAFIPAFEGEGRAFARHIDRRHPKAKVAVLAENGILGREGLNGFEQAVRSGVSFQLVAVAWHELGDPTRDSQLATLKASGADVLVNWSSPRNATQVIRRLREIGWRPVHLLSYVSTSVEAVLAPAGLDSSTGIISTGFLKQPSDPAWKDDPDMQEYFAWMKRFYPDGDPADGYNAYGYLAAQAMVHVLRKCGDDLTRENLMRQASSIRDLELPLLLPGIRVDSGTNRARPLNQLQMLRFDGSRWVRMDSPP
jgi:branched-chain amino acid transport system substrate-binding protein